MLMLKVTLKKSVIKASKAQRQTVRGLGLTKINSSRLLGDTPAIRGMILKVSHLVALEEVSD
ncbi:MAG: 50S ribosomal protein L30 [Desulfomonile sp.]